MRRIGILLVVILIWACEKSDENESGKKLNKRLSVISISDDNLIDKRTFSYDENGRLNKYISDEEFCTITYDKNKVTLMSKDWTCVCDLNNNGLATQMLISYSDTDSESEKTEIKCLYEDKHLKSLEYTEYPNTTVFPDDKIRRSTATFEYTNKALSKLSVTDGNEEDITTFTSKNIANVHNLLLGVFWELDGGPEVIVYYTGILGTISPYLLNSKITGHNTNNFEYKYDDDNIVLECSYGTKTFKYTYVDIK